MMRGTSGRLVAAAALLVCVLVVPGQVGADTSQTLTVDGATVNEAAGTADFVVKLSAGPDDATFDYATADGSANAGSDYTSKSDTKVSVPGGGQVIISVPITNDDLFEVTQSFNVNITNIAKAANATASATGNITDNDPAPVITVSPASTTVDEGQPASVTLSMANKSEAAVTVNYAKQNQSAGDDDYTLVSGSRTWGTGEEGAKPAIQAATANDAVDEDNETFRVNFSSSAQLSNEFATVTITDDDPEVTVSPVADVSVPVEGNTGTVDATVTVTLSAASGKTVTVPYSTAPGTATEDVDYDKASGTLTYTPGQTTKDIIVKVRGDTLYEKPDEKFSVVLAPPTNAGAGSDMRADVTIIDDDATPTPTLNNPLVNEGNSGLIDLVFEAQLEAPHPTVTFNYRTLVDTANASDFDLASGSKTFAANPSTAQGAVTKVPITIKVKGDLLDELDETLKLELLNNSDVVVRSATGTIKNDDNNSKLSIGDASADEPGTLKFTVTLAPGSGRAVTINWATADGTATAGVDYTAGSGGLTFAPGEVSKTIDVAVLGDAINEENETLKVALSGATGVPPGNVLDAQGDGTIIDKNAPPSLSISDTTAREGEGATFTVSLAGTTLRTVTVGFNTNDGTAKAGEDYSARTGSLSFAPGERSKTISVTVLDDTATEPLEEFSVTIGDAVNAVITKSRGVASIEASDQVAAGPTPPTTTPPTARPVSVLVPRMILGPRTVSVGADGIARMLVTCQKVSPISCSGTVELERAGKPVLKLGKKAFTVKKGAKGYASIKLTPRGLALLRKSGTVQAKVTVFVKTSTKTLKVSPGTITLKSVKTKAPPPRTKVVIDP